MLSKMLDIQKGRIELDLETKKERRPSLFEKKGLHKKKLSAQLEEDGLHEGFLRAFKEMLSKQKLEQPVSAAGPFSSLNPFILTSSDADPSLSVELKPSIQMSQLFHKLVETLIHIDNEGIQETTLFLEGDPFSSSIFEGAKITITEYSTAPKIFNIHFFADQKGLAVFESKLGELASAFHRGNYNFQVHRIDTSLSSEDEKHALRRVKRENDKEKDEGRE